MPPNKHAVLSASASHRWLNCTPSARLELEFDNNETEAAAEGTAAHALCEHKLRRALKLRSDKPTSKYDCDEMDTYVSDPNGITQPKGTIKRTTVSNVEIWCECFGKRKEDIKPSDSYAIAAIMLRLEGWRRTDAREIQPIYGRQRLYKRT